MAVTGLGAFTEGFNTRRAAKDRSRLSRQYDRKLRAEGDRADWQWDADVTTAKGKWETDPANAGLPYKPPARIEAKDPALMRLFKFVGGRIKGAFGGDQAEAGASFVSPEMAPSSPVEQQQAQGGFQSGIPGQGGPMLDQYRDGGLVKGYADGGAVEEESELVQRQRMQAAASTRRINARHGGEDAGGLGTFLSEDLPRATGEFFDDTVKGAMGGRKLGDDADAKLAGATGARERGSAMRDVGVAAVTSAAETTGGLLKDVFVDNPVTQGALGFFGFDGGGEQQAIPTSESPADVGSQKAPGVSAALKDNINAPGKTDGQMAEESMSAGQQMAIENLDYKLLVDQGIRPEELPSMSTREWADYRQGLFEREISRGVSAKVALQSVEFATVEVQMRGMQRQLDKAVLYLGTGQNQEAAMAVRQGFQYFPNGTSVKFGTVKDPKTGLPAIIAMGTDEETGESKGSPMIITAERLGVMRAQMSDPKAFSAWTKDGHDLQLQIAKFEEQKTSNVSREKIAGYNAETSRINALARAAGGGGGLSASEMRQRSDSYAKDLDANLDLMGNEADKDGLAAAMATYEAMTGNRDMAIVRNEIMNAYRADGNEGVKALLGSLRAETGIPEG